MIKKTIRLNESDLHNIINECVNKVLNENEFEHGGAYSIIDVLEKNGVNHALATAIEGAITYIGKIKNFEILGKMAKYIQDAVDDEYGTFRSKEDYYEV
jgi:hypothetical protein